ncbi:MAG: hypothetical protein P4K94_08545 [Terracidiphilus sp.]|nr:hypothetical protein [Terracidiphilus sp.]
MEHLQAFLRNLPNDGHSLPARGDRVVVRALVGGNVEVRVFDRAKLPDMLIELIGVTDSMIRVGVPVLPPSRTLDEEQIGKESESANAITIADLFPHLSFDSQVSFAESANGAIFATSQLVYGGYEIRAYRTGHDAPVFKTLVSAVAGKMIRPIYMAFNPIGTILLLETDAPEIRVYETDAWTQTDARRFVPPEATEYFPSQDWKLGVTVNSSGAAGLWDSSTHRIIASLSIEGTLNSAAFSPTGNLLAVFSSRGNHRPGHLTVRNAHNGRLLTELRSVGWHDSVWGTPIWWHGDEQLVVPIIGYVHPNTVGIWNASMGRMEGTLGGCGGAGVIVEQSQIYQHCADGRVLQWNADVLNKTSF